jgi:hypothetical protein
MNADDLRAAFAALPKRDPVTKWERYCVDLRRQVENGDLDKFLTWPTIQATMFVGDVYYIKDELDALMTERKYWREAIAETGVGKPPRLPYAKWTSGNLVHQAYHLKQWRDFTGLDVAQLERIVEVGAGYGVMPLIINRLGFRGKYWLEDFMEFQFLQLYYLAQTTDDGTWILGWPYQVMCDRSLFIALFSLSEMPLDERLMIGADRISADSYLIAYQPRWDGVDNTAYFEQFRADRPDVEWIDHEGSLMPCRYLIGKRGC